MRMTHETRILALSVALLWVRASVEPASGADVKRTPRLVDKTLVAWVSPANLAQRGGSVLTLIDGGERFDAIVLGEIAQGKWMAGSDFFRRTQRDQSAYPAETADAKALVQIAIAYKGNQISVFRNGQPYASHTVAQPQVFGRDTSVLIGLRYVGHMGEIGFFGGAIEEARIYDTGLDAQALAALEPNKPSEPKPIAQWTFEGGKADDAMGTFPAGQLRGGARIADGKLHLNGKDAYMICGGVVAEDQRMFYKPLSRQTGNLWDTWLYLHQGTFYLYYLAKRSGQWDNISMATSPDGVHWKELGPILSKADGVTWMGTGSTWRSPQFEKDGKFQMNFSEWRGPRQTIFFAESPDLVRWTRLGNEHEFVQDERRYERNGRWDCIWTLPRPGGGLYGYWTATPKPETGGRFGFGETLDGVRWKALPPPKVHGVGEGEVGAIEKIGDRYYMMFGTGGRMVTLVAEKPEGPFHAARKNLVLLGGHTYFSRFFPTPDALLVNHHSIARNGQVYFGTLKTAVLDVEGTLRLGWWKGNDKLKDGAAELKVAPPEGPADSPVAILGTALDTDSGVILEGTLALPEQKDAKPVGLYIEHAPGQGTAILVHAGGATELGPIQADGTGFKAEKRVDREIDFGKRPAFRLLLKHFLLEVYLNDILIECYSLPERATGRLGVIEHGRRGAVEVLKAWQLPSEPTP
jgi:hypothetical protein